MPIYSVIVNMFRLQEKDKIHILSAQNKQHAKWLVSKELEEKYGIDLEESQQKMRVSRY